MAELPDPETPHYSADESSEPGFVKLKVMIPLLKVKNDGVLGIFKDKKPKNATMEEPLFGERSCDIQVNGDGKGAMKGNRYRLQLERLPYSIVPRHSYIKVEDGWVIVFLKKENEDQSWERQIRAGTLDTPDKSELN